MNPPLAVCLVLLTAISPAAELTGLWRFDDHTNPAKATVGNDLVFEGIAPTYYPSAVGFGDFYRPGVIATQPGAPNRIRADHGIPAGNSPGAYVSQYTIVVDVLSPESSRDSWRTIFQTNTANANDGDYFITPSDTLGVGDMGFSTATNGDIAWQRIALTVDLSLSADKYKCYIGGSLVHTHTGTNNGGIEGRFSLDPFLYLFTDDTGDDSSLLVNAVAIYDGVLTADELSGMRNPGDTFFGEPDRFATWATDSGLDGSPGRENGPNDDPDGDSFDNYLEWILAGNPLVPDAMDRISGPTVDHATGFSVSFWRAEDAINSTALDLRYSPNLDGNWNFIRFRKGSFDAENVRISVNEATTPDRVTVTIPPSEIPNGRMFAQLYARAL